MSGSGIPSTKSRSDSASVSVVILARNEEQNIVRCVRAVSWSNDVVVVDDHSTDQTEVLATNAGARVVQHSFRNFADQRNWAMKHADLKHEWVLHLDADEVVTDRLRLELIQAISAADFELAAFRMCRKTMLGTTWLKHSDGFPVWIMRLVRAGRADFQSCGHGEIAVPSVRGRVDTIYEPFLHFAFSKGWSDWIQRHNRYSDREAELEYSTMAELQFRKLLSRDKSTRRAMLRNISRRLPFRALLRFLYQYVVKLGFLDGREGFTFCCMMATYERWIVLKRKEMEQRLGRPEKSESSINSHS